MGTSVHSWFLSMYQLSIYISTKDEKCLLHYTNVFLDLQNISNAALFKYKLLIFFTNIMPIIF
jgi:hypothetical protein